MCLVQKKVSPSHDIGKEIFYQLIWETFKYCLDFFPKGRKKYLFSLSHYRLRCVAIIKLLMYFLDKTLLKTTWVWITFHFIDVILISLSFLSIYFFPEYKQVKYCFQCSGIDTSHRILLGTSFLRTSDWLKEHDLFSERKLIFSFFFPFFC